LVDRLPSRRVDQHRVETAAARGGDTVARDGDRVASGLRGMNWDAELPAERLELLDRRRTVDVGGHQVRGAAALRAQPARELRRRGRLPRAVEADERDHHRGRAAAVAPDGRLAQEEI